VALQKICDSLGPVGESANRRLGAVPVPFPGELPPGAAIHSCEQNPWETAHVLSNGDVVACEVLDKARTEIVAAANTARSDLKKEAERLSQEITVKLLGRAV
jgi:hypothetical protein